MATQKEIRATYELFKEQIAEHEGEIEIIKARMKVNRKKCKHPNAYTYYAMGEAGTNCKDCGYCT